MTGRRRGPLVDSGYVNDWTVVARGQDGVVSADQLFGARLSHSAVARMTDRGELVRLHQGVFLVGGAPLTYRARLNGALLATDGVLGKATAAHLWGMVRAEPQPITVLLPHARRVVKPRGAELCRAVVDPQAWLVRDRLRLTTRVLTVLDYVPSLSPRDCRTFVDRALHQGWLAVQDVDDHLGRYPGRHGNGVLRRLLPELSDGAAAHSERVAHRLLDDARIGGWVPNLAVWADGELVGVLDIGFDDIRLAVEIDGWAFHSDVERFRRDRRKQNALIGLGWTVLRFTWADLVERPAYVVTTIRATLTKLRESFTRVAGKTLPKF